MYKWTLSKAVVSSRWHALPHCPWTFANQRLSWIMHKIRAASWRVLGPNITHQADYDWWTKYLEEEVVEKRKKNSRKSKALINVEGLFFFMVSVMQIVVLEHFLNLFWFMSSTWLCQSTIDCTSDVSLM